jgi:N-acetyl-alpha-D-muramate 1-phosphate uridylyltransferase
MLKVITSSAQDTAALASDLAGLLPQGAVVLLAGDLGAGKTVFSRAMIRALAGDGGVDVMSPTFNLVYHYETTKGPVAHFDLYRLKDTSEIEEIGFDDARSGRAVIVEWPDRLGDRFQKLRRAVHVKIDFVADHPHQRKFTIDMSSLITLPKTAFVFAAGLGNRMKPLTDHVPKPLVDLNGRPVLSYLFDMLEAVGVRKLVINTHHLPDQIENFAKTYRDRFDIRISHEPELLETGGGMKQALPLIDEDVFFAVNGDSPLIDAPGLPVFARLAAAFDPTRMDIMLLLQPDDARMITPWVGDYHMAPDGHSTRALDQKGTHMFGGARILHRRVLERSQPGRYSFRDNMDAAQQAGRLFGLEHYGEWHHLSTPQDVEIVARHLSQTATTCLPEMVG